MNDVDIITGCVPSSRKRNCDHVYHANTALNEWPMVVVDVLAGMVTLEVVCSTFQLARVVES